MKLLNSMMWTATGAAALAMLGCDVHMDSYGRRDAVIVQPQPQYVEQQPQYIVVQQAPPPIIVERRPAPPSAQHVWVDGYWNWDSQRYTWQVGRYVVPPQPGVIWVAPRYEGDAHRYTPGQWKKQGPGNGPGNGHGDH